MFSLIPNMFRNSKKRVTKSDSMDSLDRPIVRTGYAHIFKSDNSVKRIEPVSPLHPVAYTIRMRGIIG